MIRHVGLGWVDVPCYEDSELEKLSEFIDDDLLNRWTVVGLQAKHKVLVDSLPREKLEVLRTRLMGLRNKASMVGGGTGLGCRV